MYQPSYITLHEKKELQRRIKVLMEILKRCRLCPRACKVNRLDGEKGYCQAGADVMISSAFPHFGEEPPLVGYRGSGTIFLAHCNLRCVFCQNYDISHLGGGEHISSSELAQHMIALQRRGCHNINVVTPTHYIPQIVAALPEAIELGLMVPLVYNCGGYESLEVIKLLDGIIDIYMPDTKFSREENAASYCNAPDYPQVLQEVLLEMHRQVGDLMLDGRGIAYRGLLIRHLVMPHGVAGTKEIMSFIAQHLSGNSYVNIMDQYRPLYRAGEYPAIDRRISSREYREAIDIAKGEGLHRGF
ncbi:MAG: radical SAM protein [Deltaproteobacteria bacterium RBG_13_52_11]|nr:MAG: radical SAM protein [Deltaproteobacteria bacterium RBG_13_52_11]